jgi:hypothetical protein
MKYLKSALLIILINIFLTASITAQSEQGYLLGIKYFEKSFPSLSSDWDSFANLYMDTHYDGKLSSSKLGLKINDVIGKEMIYKYGHYDVHLVMTSDSTLYIKNTKTGETANEKMSTIQIDEKKMLSSFIDTENNLVTMLSDFDIGKASAFLYKDDGTVIPLSGSIKMKK